MFPSFSESHWSLSDVILLVVLIHGSSSHTIMCSFTAISFPQCFVSLTSPKQSSSLPPTHVMERVLVELGPQSGVHDFHSVHMLHEPRSTQVSFAASYSK